MEDKVPIRLDFLWHLHEGVRLLRIPREDDLQEWDTSRAEFLFVLLGFHEASLDRENG